MNFLDTCKELFIKSQGYDKNQAGAVREMTGAKFAEVAEKVKGFALKSGGKFKLQKSSDGQFYSTLEARNGEVLNTSETVETKQSAKKNIKAVRTLALFAEVVDETKV